MSESCIVVKEIDCDTALLVTETPTTVIDTSDPVVIIVDEGDTSINAAGEDLSVIVREEPTTVIEKEDTVVLLVTCEQGPAGQDGLDGTGVVEVASGPVTSGNTVVADSVALAAIRSVKWIVTLTDSTAGTYKSYEVLGVHNGTTILHTVYGLIGDVILITTNVAINAPNMELQITNNDTNDLDIKVQRIATTI